MHGERLVNKPATKTTTYVAGVTPTNIAGLSKSSMVYATMAAGMDHHQAVAAPTDRLVGQLYKGCPAM